MFAGQLENEEETMAKPLTPKEYQHWKDTSLIEEDTIDRFAATLDFLFTTNTKLLTALENSADKLHSLRGDPDCSYYVFRECPKYYCKDARDALDQTEKKE